MGAETSIPESTHDVNSTSNQALGSRRKSGDFSGSATEVEDELETVKVQLLPGLTIKVKQATQSWQERMLDEASLAEDGSIEEDPYGIVIWPSSLVVAQAVSTWVEMRKKQNDSPHAPSLRVLELGCGTGLASLAAAKLGLEVLATDFREQPLRILEEAARRQHLPLKTALFDLIQDTQRCLPPADLVVASDLLYKKTAKPLASRVAEARARGSTVIIGDPGRRYGKDFLKRVQRHCPIDLIHEVVFSRLEGFIRQGHKKKRTPVKIGVNILELPPRQEPWCSLDDIVVHYPTGFPVDDWANPEMATASSSTQRNPRRISKNSVGSRESVGSSESNISEDVAGLGPQAENESKERTSCGKKLNAVDLPPVPRIPGPRYPPGPGSS